MARNPDEQAILNNALFADKPWTQLPETEEDEEDEQDFDIPNNEVEDEVEEDEEEEDSSQEIATESDSQDYGLPDEPMSYGDLAEEFGEDSAPPGFKQLFDTRRDTDITKLTETPARMVLPLVRAEIIDAAYDVRRMASGESLLSVFVKAFDRRMISKDRKGRLEAVELIRGINARGDGDEEEAML